MIAKVRLKRVDAQVSIFTAVVVILSCVTLFIFNYTMTYNDMIAALEERVYSIYSYLDGEMDDSTFFDINTKEDITKPSYTAMKELFKNMKQATGVRYLYTAKKNADGNLIYVIDGLPDEAEDFRYPGDLIEEEIVDNLNLALSGEYVLPDDIVPTGWGEIFITYMPIHSDNGDVIGAVGIEFEANHQYNTYRNMRFITPFIILITCLLSATFAIFFFRRVSNPNYQDMSNTDYLTGVKNRNAYEVDIKNLCAMDRTNGKGVILADLNGLKMVNDSKGHDAGDRYIQSIVEAMRAARINNEVIYRLGGDEFLVLINDASLETLGEFVERANTNFSNMLKTDPDISGTSCSFGYAICSGNKREDFEDAYRKADANMYEIKKKYYSETQILNHSS